jgi:hypothetical protein
MLFFFLSTAFAQSTLKVETFQDKTCASTAITASSFDSTACYDFETLCKRPELLAFPNVCTVLETSVNASIKGVNFGCNGPSITFNLHKDSSCQNMILPMPFPGGSDMCLDGIKLTCTSKPSLADSNTSNKNSNGATLASNSADATLKLMSVTVVLFAMALF